MNGPAGSPNLDTPGSRRRARRLIPAWEYRRLRACGGTRIGAGLVLGGLGVVTLSFGGHDAKTYRWTAFWLLLGALDNAFGSWELRVARSG